MMTLFGVIQQSKYLLCPPMAYLSFTQNEDSAGSAGGRQAAIDSFCCLRPGSGQVTTGTTGIAGC